MDAVLDRAVERSRAADVEKHHAPAPEPKPSKTPLHDALSCYTREQALDAIADIIVPPVSDPEAIAAIWGRVCWLILAREKKLPQIIQTESAADLGNLIADAAEQYLRGAA